MSVKVINGNFFRMPAGSYCGVIMPEKVAKKIQKVLMRQSDEIRDILMTHKDELYLENWTLAYPDDKQTTVYYIDESHIWDSVEERINLFRKEDRIRHIDHLFYSDKESYMEAVNEVEDYCNRYLSKE